MKKWIFPGFFAIVVTTYFFFLGQWSRQYFYPETSVPTPVPLSSPVSPAVPTSNEIQKLSLRLRNAYPKPTDHHSQIYQRELQERLSFLQKWENIDPQMDREVFKDLLGFYKSILKSRSEPWIIKRQVLKNMSPYWHHVKERERDHILSRVDLRARHLATMSDKELLQKLADPHAR